MQNVDFKSYADDNTIYNAGDNIDEIIFSLQESSKKLFKWFVDNQMKTNDDKCQLNVSTNELTKIQIGDFSIKISDSEKLLSVNIDSKLNFDCHVNELCNKASEKLRELARITPYMTLEIFFNAQFTTAPSFGFFTVAKIVIKSNIYMNDVYD